MVEDDQHPTGLHPHTEESLNSLNIDPASLTLDSIFAISNVCEKLINTHPSQVHNIATVIKLTVEKAGADLGFITELGDEGELEPPRGDLME